MVDDLGYADMSFLPQAPDDVKQFGTPALDQLAASGTYFSDAYATSPICSPSRVGFITGRYQQRWGNYHYHEGGLDPKELTIPQALSRAGYATYKIGKTHLNGGPVEFPTLHGFDRFFGFMNHTWDYIRLSEKDLKAYSSRLKKNPGSERQYDPAHKGPFSMGALTYIEGQGKSEAEAEKRSYENAFTTELFSEAAVSYIEEMSQVDQPFYLQLSHNAVHQPTYITDKKWAEKVNMVYREWDRDAESWDFPYWDPDKVTGKHYHKTWGHMGEVYKDGRRAYLSHLLALDYGVGLVLEALQQQGMRENTLVVFLSDNGGTINTYSDNTPLEGYKYMQGEGGIRIPLIVSMPGTLPEGKVIERALVSAMDVFPTIVDLLDLNVDAAFDGMSLLPLLRGDRRTQHDHLLWASSRDQWSIRQGDWKLSREVTWRHTNFEIDENGNAVQIEDYVFGADQVNGLRLVNLETDVGEKTNVLREHPEVVSQLQALYDAWASEMAEPQFVGHMYQDYAPEGSDTKSD